MGPSRENVNALELTFVFLLFVFSGISDFHPLHCQNADLQSRRVPVSCVHVVRQHRDQRKNVLPVEGLTDYEHLWVLQKPGEPAAV